MFGLKLPEMLVIVLIILVLFGGSRVANLGRDLGQGIRNFKRGFNGEDEGASPGQQNGNLTANNGTDNRGAARTPSSATKDA